jgi:hypothetical protein
MKLRTSNNCTRIIILVLFFASLKMAAQPLTANAGSNTSTCLGSAITIGGSPSASFGSPPYTYSWSPSAGLSSTTAANPSANPAATTTYTLLVTDAVSGTSSATIIINVNPVPVATAVASTTVCHGTSPNIVLNSSVGGSSFSWTASQSNATGASASSGSAIVQYLNATTTSPGNVTYTITATAAGCVSAPITSSVTVNPAPVMTSSGTATICSGSTVNIPFSSDISSTYTWSATDNVNTTGESTTTQSSSTLNNTITSSAPTSTNVSYTVQPTSISGGCPGSFWPVTVTVNSLPIVNATPGSQTICSGGTANISLSSSIPGTSYSWAANFSGASGAASGCCAISQVLNTTTGSMGSATYTITATAAGCTGTPITANVTVNPLATVSVNSPTICSGGSAVLTASPSIGGGTYVWSGGGSASSTTVSPATTTTYTCTYTSPAGCVSNGLGTVYVTIPPVATFSYIGTPYCQNGTNPFPNYSGGGVAGTFSSTAGLVFISVSTGQINLAASTAGTYTVTNTIAASGGCSAVISTTSITITSLPIAAFSYAGGSYCQNDPNPFPTFSGGGVAGTFSSTAGLAFISTTTGQVNLFSTTSGTYIVTNTIAASGGCPTVSATSNISRNADATIGLTSAAGTNAQTVCVSTPITNITYNIGGGGTGGTVIGLPSGVSGSFAGGTFTITGTPTVPGTYNYTVNTTGICTQTSKNGTITVNALPVVNVNSPTICPGSSASLTASGASTYSWTAGATPTGVNTADASPGSTTSYTVTGTDVAGCSATAVSTVTVGTLPSLSISAMTNPSCNGSCNGTATVLATGGYSPYSYNWSPGGGGAATATALCAGPYNITVTNSIGCSSSIPVTLTEPTAVSGTIISQTNVLCFGGNNGSATISGMGGTSPYTYSIDGGLTFQGSGTFTGMAAGSFSVIIKDNNGCTIILPVTITQPTLLNSSAGSGSTICAGDTAILTGFVSGGTPAYTFLWNTAEVTTSISVSPTSTTTYTISVTDANGCNSSSTATVTVSPASNIYGHVSYSGGVVGSGTNNVVLYNYLPFATSFDTIMVSTLDGTGNYIFASVLQGDYLIKIFPDTLVNPTLVPTYYGNEFLWDSAMVVTHACSSTIADITMIETPPAIGPGTVSGTVYEDSGFIRTPGDPIPGVDIKLGRNPGGQLVTFTETGTGATSGQYSFSNLPVNLAGEYYTIYVDIPGLTRDSTYSFVVTGTDTTFNGLDYFADSNSVYPNASTVGIISNSSPSAKLSVYPNPSKGNATIEYAISSDSQVSLGVYNILGIRIIALADLHQSMGTYKINMNEKMKDLAPGVYFIALLNNGKTYTQRLIISE